MTKEFKIKKFKDATVYTLESATAGGTSAGSVASVSSPVGGVRRRSDSLIAQEEKKEAPKPRNFVAKNAKMGGAGAHKDKKKAQKQGNEKHKKPYMEDLKDRISELKSKLDEVSLKGFGDYAKKAQMDKALSQIGSAFAANPDDRAKNLAKAAKREKGLAMHKTRVDKHWAEKNAIDKAEREQKIRDKYAGVDIDAEIAKLQPAIERAYHEYQYGARNTWSQGRDDYERLKSKVRELEQAKEIIGGVDEDAPFLAKAAGGLALGALGAAGAPAIVGLLGPILGTAIAAYGAYNSAKAGMWSVDKLWDLAAKKLGGDDNAAEFSKAHIRAAAKGEDSFNFAGKDFPVKLKPNEVQPAAKAVKELSESKRIAKELLEGWKATATNEDHSTASKGWGNASYDAYSNTRHGRGVAEKLDPNAPTDVWVQDFQKADPNKYHQFKNKTPQKKAQMAVAAHYAANEPSKK